MFWYVYVWYYKGFPSVIMPTVLWLLKCSIWRIQWNIHQWNCDHSSYRSVKNQFKTLKNVNIDKVCKLLTNWKWFILKWSVSCSVVSDSLRPCGLQPTRLLCPWDSSGNDTEVGCHALLQGIFLIQESNLRLPMAPELQAEKATHFSVLAWRIPWTE